MDLLSGDVNTHRREKKKDVEVINGNDIQSELIEKF